jgi:hypothetical protein
MGHASQMPGAVGGETADTITPDRLKSKPIAAGFVLWKAALPPLPVDDLTKSVIESVWEMAFYSGAAVALSNVMFKDPDPELLMRLREEVLAKSAEFAQAGTALKMTIRRGDDER